VWGTATVRGETDVIVRRLDVDHGKVWKSDLAVNGTKYHDDSDVEAFVAYDWSWLERRAMRNPESESFWDWYSTLKLGVPYWHLAFYYLWSQWGLGVSWDRQYGSMGDEEGWSIVVSLGPLHASLQRFKELPA
jgi:hypothetical protein